MLSILIVGCCALIFYRIGEMDYGRGALLATISLVASVLSGYVLPLPFVSIIASQVLLYLALLVYNLSRKTPPRL